MVEVGDISRFTCEVAADLEDEVEGMNLRKGVGGKGWQDDGRSDHLGWALLL